MKAWLAILSLSTAGWFALCGCSRSQSAAPAPPPPADSPTLDMRGLMAALATSTSPDVKKGCSDLYVAMRYRDYTKAGAALDQLAADPTLTDAQKKAVSNAQEQVKQMASAPKGGQ